jgi:GTP-binding protein
MPTGAGGSRPIVAIVGRPNVGKSTLFNRLCGRRLAIVNDRAGVTRDRHYADAVALDREYVLVDTGGFDPKSDDPRATGIAAQVRVALDECDVIICVLDATTDPMPADREAVRLLRRTRKPILFVANKAENRARAQEGLSHYELGMDALRTISAMHGHGIDELEEAIAGALPTPVEVADIAGKDAPRVAIVGRPNAGKSSLVNRLLGQERQLVEDTAGTTMDSIDSLLVHKGAPWVLIDTAGIRRKRSVEKGLEGLAVLSAIRAVERSHAVVFLIDADAGTAEQDAKIVNLIEERGRALVLVLNKSDLLGGERRKRAITRTRELLRFVPWAELVTISAKTGRGVAKLLDAVGRAIDSHRKRVPTSEVNRFFEEVLDRHPPPTFRKRTVRLFYVTQAQTRPPSFVVITNQPAGIHESYQRYVKNQLRERFGFQGTPIRVWYRAKRRDS